MLSDNVNTEVYPLASLKDCLALLIKPLYHIQYIILPYVPPKDLEQHNTNIKILCGSLPVPYVQSYDLVTMGTNSHKLSVGIQTLHANFGDNSH